MTSERLKINNIEKKKLQRLDNLVKETTNLFSNPNSQQISGFQNIKEFERNEMILLEEVIGLSNFEKVCNNLKINYWFFDQFTITILRGLLAKLAKDKRYKKNFTNLLKLLKKYLENARRKSEKTISFYIPLRLETYSLKDDELKNLKSIISKNLKISLVKPPKKFSKFMKSDNFKSIFYNRQWVANIRVNSRDLNFSDKIAESRLNTFFGLFLLSSDFGRDKRMWKKGSQEGKYEIFSKILEQTILVLEDGKMVHPSDWWFFDTSLSKKDISIIGKQIWNIHNKPNGNYPFLMESIKLLGGMNEEIGNLLRDSLNIYYSAMTEGDLTVSFLKFWIIVEKIVNCGNMFKENNFKKRVNFILSEKDKPFFETIYKKRNLFVHSHNAERISQLDRNFIKNIAERLLLFLIDYPFKINNLVELGFVMDNIKSDLKSTNSKISLLSKIKKHKTKNETANTNK